MKNSIFLNLRHILFPVLSVFLYGGCEKNNCPAPVGFKDNDTTRLKQYNVILKQDPTIGIDVALTYNTFGAGNVNGGNFKTLYAEAWTNMSQPQNLRALIDFNLDSIPVGAMITKAELILFADTVNTIITKKGHQQLAGAENSWVIKKAKTPWNEHTVTWNTQPLTYDDDTLLMPASNFFDDAYHIDLTSFIVQKRNNPSSHYGYLFKTNTEFPYRSVAFCSSDHQYPELRPVLRVEYLKP